MKAIAVLLTALVGMILSQRSIEAQFGTRDYERRRLAAWSGPRLNHLFAGFELAAADLYWLRTVQYYGGQRSFQAVAEFDLVEPLVENVVALDPRFSIAYRLGAVFLAEPPPVGQGRPQAALRLLVRGVGALQDDWFLHRDAALFRFEYLGDGAGAAAALRESAARPGAPFWLLSLSGELARKSGDPEGAREAWLMLADSDLPFVRENAKRNLLRLDALSMVRVLQSKVDQFRADTGAYPTSWSQLIAVGAIRQRPRDPLGIELSLTNGLVAVSRGSLLWRSDLHTSHERKGGELLRSNDPR